MNVNILTQKQMKLEIKEQVAAREFHMENLINKLHQKIIRLEEELKVHR